MTGSFKSDETDRQTTIVNEKRGKKRNRKDRFPLLKLTQTGVYCNLVQSLVVALLKGSVIYKTPR